jgi:hypothetical protein
MNNETEKQLADKLKEVNEAFNTLADRMQSETIKTYFTKSEVEAIVKEQHDANADVYTQKPIKLTKNDA